MCGIVGYSQNSPEAVKAMLASLRHRGPDDFGIYHDSHFSLGHTRLSILDLSSAGHQPMEFENLVIIFNGEIYNFQEIRIDLERCGYTFHSDSDTEVLLKAFHYYGIKAIEKCIGMFSIALWDKQKEELLLFRDRMGVKPLYYTFYGENLLFGSEVRAITTIKKNLTLDSEALHEYFRFGYISSNLSIYQEIKRLPAGHYLRYSKGKIELACYWSILPFLEMPPFEKSDAELIDELEALLIDAFKLRMVSDVPVGVFLSGGIDSSLVAAILQKHHGNIHTFTIGFNEAQYNEAHYAKKVAQHIGTTHTERILGALEAKEILKSFIQAYDEPFGDSSGLPTLLVAQIAKESGMKVVLSADGGDELFCGYSRYPITHRWGRRILALPYPLKAVASGLIQGVQASGVAARFLPPKLSHRIQKLQESLAKEEWQSFYELLIASAQSSELKQLLTSPPPPSRINLAFATGEKIHPMQGMMAWDFERYMVDDILVKVDRATMFHSIEGREPLLDHRIAEFAARLPFHLRYREGKSKYILRKILERYIPKELIERPKMGFGIPMMEWFGEDLRSLFHHYFKEERLAKSDLLNSGYVLKQLKALEKNRAYNINHLWLILVFLMWQEREG